MMLDTLPPNNEDKIVSSLTVEALLSKPSDELDQVIEILTRTKIAPLWRYTQSEIKL